MVFAPTDLCALRWRPDFADSGHRCQRSCAALPTKRHVCCHAAESVSTASKTYRQHTSAQLSSAQHQLSSESTDAAKRVLISLASKGPSLAQPAAARRNGGGAGSDVLSTLGTLGGQDVATAYQRGILVRTDGGIGVALRSRVQLSLGRPVHCLGEGQSCCALQGAQHASAPA